MGKVCFSYDILLITDNDIAMQDDKSPPPCMQLQAGVGFLLPMRTHPPPRLQLRDGVGFFHAFFFKSTNDDNDEPCRLVVFLGLYLHSTTTMATNKSSQLVGGLLGLHLPSTTTNES